MWLALGFLNHQKYGSLTAAPQELGPPWPFVASSAQRPAAKGRLDQFLQPDEISEGNEEMDI